MDRAQLNGKASGRDLSICQRQQEMQPPTSSADLVKAKSGDVHILHNHIHSAPGAPTQNTQFHGNGMDESKKKSPTGPNQTAGPGDASKQHARVAVKPGRAELAVDTAAGKDGGVGTGAGEIPAGNLRSWDNNAPCVREPAAEGGPENWANACLGKEMKMNAGKGMTEMPTVAEKRVESERNVKHVPHKNENGGLPWAQVEKAIANTSSKSSMIVQVRLLEGPHPEKVLQNVPEVPGNVGGGVTNAVRTSEPKPEAIQLKLRVPQLLDRTCSKTFLKSQVENTIEPPTPLSGNTPTTPEQLNLQKETMAEDSTLIMAESSGKTIPVTPIQQIRESKKDHTQLKEIQKAETQDQEVKSGREMANANSCDRHSACKATDSASLICDSRGGSEPRKTDTDHHLNSVQPSVRAPPKAPTFVVPPIPITDTDGTLPENSQPSTEAEELDSIATLLEGVMNDLESCVTLSAVGNKEIHSTPCCVEKATHTNVSDAPLGITTPEPGAKETPPSLSESSLEKVILRADVIDTQRDKEEEQKQPRLASDTFSDQHVKDKSDLHKSNLINPQSPLPSPSTPRRDPARNTPDMDASGLLPVPVIRVNSAPLAEKHSGEGTARDALPPPGPSCDSSPRLAKRDSLTPIPSATAEELALGARRKIFIPKSKTEEAEVAPGLTDALAKTEDVPKRRVPSQEQEAPGMSPSLSRRPSLLQLPAGQQTPPFPRRSPLLTRKKTTLEVPKCPEETVKEPDTIKTEPKSAETNKPDPLKGKKISLSTTFF